MYLNNIPANFSSNKMKSLGLKVSRNKKKILFNKKFIGKLSYSVASFLATLCLSSSSDHKVPKPLIYDIVYPIQGIKEVESTTSPGDLEQLVRTKAKKQGIHKHFVDLYFSIPHKGFMKETEKYFPNVPSSLIEGVMKKESSFNPDAVSKVGALGYTQLTAEAYKQLTRIVYSEDNKYKNFRKDNPNFKKALESIIHDNGLENKLFKRDVLIGEIRTKKHQLKYLKSKGKTSKDIKNELFEARKNLKEQNLEIFYQAKNELKGLDNNEYKNIVAGRAMLSYLILELPTLRQAIAAYKDGEGVVKRLKRVPRRKTTYRYVGGILTYSTKFQKIDDIAESVCASNNVPIESFYEETYHNIEEAKIEVLNRKKITKKSSKVAAKYPPKNAIKHLIQKGETYWGTVNKTYRSITTDTAVKLANDARKIIEFNTGDIIFIPVTNPNYINSVRK